VKIKIGLGRRPPPRGDLHQNLSKEDYTIGVLTIRLEPFTNQ